MWEKLTFRRIKYISRMVGYMAAGRQAGRQEGMVLEQETVAESFHLVLQPQGRG